MQNSKVANIVQHLNKLQPLNFMEDETVKSSFLSLYQSTHPDDDIQKAKHFYERETHFLQKIISGNPDLQKATIFSLYSCLLDIATNGLTFDQASGLVYIETRNVNTAPKNSPEVWEKRAANKITAYGELALRIKYNQVKYVDTPVIVYEGDTFQVGYNERNERFVKFLANIPRNSNKIIASFIKVVRVDGSIDIPYLTSDDINRLANYSLRQNSRGNTQGKSAPLYTNWNGGIDPGFLAAKTIRHAFKAYPKIDLLGSNSSLDEDLAEVIAIEQEDQYVNGTPAAQPEKQILPTSQGQDTSKQNTDSVNHFSMDF